ncbi:Histonelysine Nmethyltransferase SETD7like [Caligus rogercresseyi]|uniref:Histonelysine Nmethyltransferase SETD7like n=1 Tax=Caligus rogercresseyi TaxID=217165 RepID=A0A7T8KD96_CALRO|nr:Histonelysine Nmethyltransferase SETD7like [Caligus rogercresseyi]
MSNRSHTLANTGPLDPSFRRNVILFLQECRDDMFFTLSQEKHRLRDLNGYFILYPSVGSTCRDDLNVHRIKGYLRMGIFRGYRRLSIIPILETFFGATLRMGFLMGLVKDFAADSGVANYIPQIIRNCPSTWMKIQFARILTRTVKSVKIAK